MIRYGEEMGDVLKLLAIGQKDKDNKMIDLFSEKLDEDMFRNIGSVTDEMFNSGIAKLEKMLESVPKDRRSEVINTALIKAMGRSEDLMKEGGFGNRRFPGCECRTDHYSQETKG